MKKQDRVIYMLTLHTQFHCCRYCFIVYIKTNAIYKDIVKDIKTRFGTSNYELDRSFLKGKNKKL